MGNVNVDLMRQTMQEIRDHQDRWHQGEFIKLQDSTDPACGTTLCFAGWAACLAGAEFVPPEKYAVNADGVQEWWQPGRVVTPEGVERSVDHYAAEVLGLDSYQANSIFYCFTKDIDVLEQAVEDVIEEDEYESWD